MEIFVRGRGNNEVHHNYEKSVGGEWSGWNSLGGQISSNIEPFFNIDGKLLIIVRGLNNDEVHINGQVPGSRNEWAGWNSLGGRIISDIDAVADRDGRVEIFARGGDSAVWHLVRSAWTSLGGRITSDIKAEKNVDGRLEIFAVGTDNRPTTILTQSR